MADTPIAEPEPGIDKGKLAMGVFFVAFGLLFLFDRLFWIDLHEVLRLWPVWLIGFGLIRVAFPGRRGRLSGFWPILVGIIFLLDTLERMSIHDSWPLFIVGGGLLMTLRALGIGRCARRDDGMRP